MAQIKTKNEIKKFRTARSREALIDSRRSRHFFHSNSSFSDYQAFQPQDAQSASELSVEVGKGRVFIPLAEVFFMAHITLTIFRQTFF